MAFDLKRITKSTGIASSLAKAVPGVKGLLGDTGIGEFLGISTKNVWRLKMKDLDEQEFKGQFLAENLTENVGARISSNNSLNKQATDSKYLGGDAETITFTTRIWATHSIKNVKKSIETLKGFTRRDDSLKRAPIFTFTAGTEFQALVFVKSVGGIKYDRMRSDGSIRGATFSVALTVIEQIETKQSSLSIASLVKSGLGIVSAVQGLASGGFGAFGKISIPGGSLHSKGKKVIVKDGETFEHLAQKEYGDALVGDVLRRAHYNKPLNELKSSLEVGDVVDMVAEDEIFGIQVTPQSIPLKDNETALENIKDQFELRGGTKKVYV